MSASQRFQLLHSATSTAGTVGDRLDEHGVVQHLDIDTDLIHVLETQIDVAQLARLLLVGEFTSDLLLAPFQFLRGECRKAKSSDLAVDQPEL